MTTSPKAARLNQELVLPIISGLCSIAIQRSASDNEELQKQEELVDRFVREARDRGNEIHICRALSMKSSFFARLGSFSRAIEAHAELHKVYDVERHSSGIREEYGKDYAAQCVSDCVQWYCLVGNKEMALDQTDLVVSSLVPHLDLRDVDTVMEIIFPVLMVMKSMGRCEDAESVLFNNAINPYHDLNGTSSFGFQLFNPLAYLLEIIKMEETGTTDPQLLAEIEDWVLDGDNCIFNSDWERKGYVLIGEICWRLVRFKIEADEESEDLLEKCRRVLMRVVYGQDDDQSDAFILDSARKILKALDEMEDDDDEYDEDEDLMVVQAAQNYGTIVMHDAYDPPCDPVLQQQTPAAYFHHDIPPTAPLSPQLPSDRLSSLATKTPSMEKAAYVIQHEANRPQESPQQQEPDEEYIGLSFEISTQGLATNTKAPASTHPPLSTLEGGETSGCCTIL